MRTNDSGSLETADCSNAQLIESCDRCSQPIEWAEGEPQIEGNSEEIDR